MDGKLFIEITSLILKHYGFKSGVCKVEGPGKNYGAITAGKNAIQ